VCVLKL